MNNTTKKLIQLGIFVIALISAFSGVTPFNYLGGALLGFQNGWLISEYYSF